MFEDRLRRASSTVGIALVGLSLLAAPALAKPAALTLVSRATDNQPAGGHSFDPSISDDGRLVAFSSTARDLVPGGTNGWQHIFVYDHATTTISLVSTDSAGVQGSRSSMEPAISGNGRYVAFASLASNLVADDTNGTRDVFVHDRLIGTTTRVSVDSAGGQADGASMAPAINADGSIVAFSSDASNLVVGDTNSRSDIFIHNPATGVTSRVSVDSGGGEADAESGRPVVSADGRQVAFVSWASNLVAGDSNAVSDVFVHDRAAGSTSRVSVGHDGAEGNDYSYAPSLSADGRHVAFTSVASNLVPGDTGGSWDQTVDVFVRDLLKGTTDRVSVSSGGEPGNSGSSQPSISSDGRHVAFSSAASNLVAGDGNFRTDIFVHDLTSGATVRINLSNSGDEADHASGDPSISGAGRRVAFYSIASNLAPSDTESSADVFLYDVAGGSTAQD